MARGSLARGSLARGSWLFGSWLFGSLALWLVALGSLALWLLKKEIRFQIGALTIEFKILAFAKTLNSHASPTGEA